MSSSASRVARIAKQLAPSETKSEASIAPAPTSGSFAAVDRATTAEATSKRNM